jgi:hypothetical protein
MAALCALSLATLGVRANSEYVTAVLPAHALSELGSDAQLSFSAILRALGLSQRVSLQGGTISFIAAALGGIVFARALARRFKDDAFIVAAPAALAVVGGVFMHVTEIAAAVPLTLLLWMRIRVQRRWVVAALALIAVPWWSLATPMLWGWATGLLLAAFTTYYFTVSAFEGKPLPAACITAGVIGLAGGLLHWHEVAAAHVATLHAPGALLHALYPEAGWRWFNNTYMSTHDAASWLLRCGTWSGLGLMLCACAMVWPRPPAVAA